MNSRTLTMCVCVSLVLTVLGDRLEAAQDTLVLAAISGSPAKESGRMQPLAEYVAAHLGEVGITSGAVKIAADFETLKTWITTGEADVYFDSLYPALMICDQTGAQPILRRWKDGVAEYHAVLFARADSGLTSLEDLKGKMLAFEEPFSTSGYMLPLAYLREKGLQVRPKEQADSAVASDEIGYLFSQQDQNMIQWVLRQKVVAGVVDDESFLDIPAEIRKNLTILLETEKVARQVVVVRSGLDPSVVTALTTILRSMDGTVEGQAVLKKFKKTAKFDDFPEGVTASLERMRALYELTQTP